MQRREKQSVLSQVGAQVKVSGSSFIRWPFRTIVRGRGNLAVRRDVISKRSSGEKEMQAFGLPFTTGRLVDL